MSENWDSMPFLKDYRLQNRQIQIIFHISPLFQAIPGRTGCIRAPGHSSV